MANRKYGNVCVSTGEFQAGNSNQKQKRWARIGLAFQDTTTGEISVKLETLPMPKMQADGFPAVWLRIFREEGTEQRQRQERPAQPPFPGSTGRTAGRTAGGTSGTQCQREEGKNEAEEVADNGVPF